MLDQMIGQFVKVEGNTVFNHLINVKQIFYFRDIVKEEHVERLDQCSGNHNTGRPHEIPSLPHVSNFVNGDFIQ